MDIRSAAGLFARRIDPDALRTPHDPDKRSLGNCLPATDTGSLWFMPATSLFTSGHASSCSRHSLPGGFSKAVL